MAEVSSPASEFKIPAQSSEPAKLVRDRNTIVGDEYPGFKLPARISAFRQKIKDKTGIQDRLDTRERDRLASLQTPIPSETAKLNKLNEKLAPKEAAKEQAKATPRVLSQEDQDFFRAFSDRINAAAKNDRLVTDAINTGDAREIADANGRALNRAAAMEWAAIYKDNPDLVKRLMQTNPKIQDRLDEYARIKEDMPIATGRTIGGSSEANEQTADQTAGTTGETTNPDSTTSDLALRITQNNEAIRLANEELAQHQQNGDFKSALEVKVRIQQLKNDQAQLKAEEDGTTSPEGADGVPSGENETEPANPDETPASGASEYLPKTPEEAEEIIESLTTSYGELIPALSAATAEKNTQAIEEIQNNLDLIKGEIIRLTGNEEAFNAYASVITKANSIIEELEAEGITSEDEVAQRLSSLQSDYDNSLNALKQSASQKVLERSSQVASPQAAEGASPDPADPDPAKATTPAGDPPAQDGSSSPTGETPAISQTELTSGMKFRFKTGENFEIKGQVERNGEQLYLLDVNGETRMIKVDELRAGLSAGDIQQITETKGSSATEETADPKDAKIAELETKVKSLEASLKSVTEASLKLAEAMAEKDEEKRNDLVKAALDVLMVIGASLGLEGTEIGGRTLTQS